MGASDAKKRMLGGIIRLIGLCCEWRASDSAPTHRRAGGGRPPTARRPVPHLCRVMQSTKPGIELTRLTKRSILPASFAYATRCLTSRERSGPRHASEAVTWMALGRRRMPGYGWPSGGGQWGGWGQ